MRNCFLNLKRIQRYVAVNTRMSVAKLQGEVYKLQRPPSVAPRETACSDKSRRVQFNIGTDAA